MLLAVVRLSSTTSASGIFHSIYLGNNFTHRPYVVAWHLRDRIPEIIATNNRTYGIEIMDDNAYLQALLTKLVEEATEAAEAENPGYRLS